MRRNNMNFNTKKILTASCLVLSFALVSLPQSVVYGQESQSVKSHQVAETQTMAEVSQSEGIAAEQIVVKITSEGYVTSHGDHYHFYNGAVPEDAIFSQQIVAPQDYQFQDKDKVSEVKNGYIIQQGEDYFLYLKDPNQRDNIRMPEEIMLQSNGIKPEDAKAIYQLKDFYQLEAASKINYHLEKTPEQVDKETKESGDHILVYLFEDGYASLKNFDINVFQTEIPEDMKISQELLAPKDYIFKQSDMIRQIKAGKIVKIKDKFYVCSDQESEKSYHVSVKESKDQAHKSYEEFVAKGGKRETPTAGQVVGGSGSRNSSGAYVTDDGYVFSPYDVIKDLGDGFIVPHGDHFHFIPKADLTASELEIAHSILGGNKSHVPQAPAEVGQAIDKILSDKPGNASNHPSQSGKLDPYTTDDGYVFSIGSIISADESGVIATHGDHFHYIPYQDLNSEELRLVKEKFAKNSPKPSPITNPDKDNNRPGHTSPVVTPEPSKPGDSKPPHHEDKGQTGKSQKEKLLEQLLALPMSQRYREADGLVFDPREIIKSVNYGGKVGYILPHGDHSHVIFEGQLSPLEVQLARLYTGKTSGDMEQPSQPAPSPAKPSPIIPTPVTPGILEPETPKPSPIKPEPAKPEPSKPEPTKPTPVKPNPEPKKKAIDLTGWIGKQIPKGQDGKPYTTSDGYTFTPESIVEYDKEGILAKHGDHMHYIPFNELEDSELKAAQDYINKHLDQVKPVGDGKYSEEAIAFKLTYLSLTNGVPVKDLKVTGDQVIIPHGNHSHTAKLSELPDRLHPDDFEDISEYRDTLMGMKMQLLRLKYPEANVIRDKTTIIVENEVKETSLPGNQPKPETMKFELENVELPLKYEEVDYAPYKEEDDTPLDWDAIFGRTPSSENTNEKSPESTHEGSNKDETSHLEEKDDEESEVADEEITDTTSQPSEPVSEETAPEEVSNEVLISYLASYYEVPLSNVKPFANGFIIEAIDEAAENIFVSYDEALAAYEGGGSLPS